MKNIRRKILVASVCLCMSVWAVMPCLVFGADESGGDVNATKTGPATVTAGETVTYNISATITGNEDDTYPVFKITDNLPAELEYISCTVSLHPLDGCTMDVNTTQSGNGVTVEILHNDDGDMESYVCVGEKVDMTVMAKVKDGVAVGTSITNTATFQLATFDTVSKSSTATVVSSGGSDDPGSGDGHGAGSGGKKYDKSPDCGDHFMDFWWLWRTVKNLFV